MILDKYLLQFIHILFLVLERYFSKILSTEDLDELNGERGGMSRQKSLHHREIEGTFINYEK